MTPARTVAVGINLALCVLLSGCARTHQARLAGDLAGIWLQPPAKGPLIVCGVEVPDSADIGQAQRAISLQERTLDTGRLLLRESVLRLRFSGRRTIGHLVAQGAPVLGVAEGLVAISEVVFPSLASRPECDEYEVAAINQKLAELQDLTDDVDRFGRFVERYDPRNGSHATYLVSEIVRIQEKFERIENGPDVGEIALSNRRDARATLRGCRKNPAYVSDCAFRIESDRRRGAGEPPIDRHAFLAERAQAEDDSQ
jgi:hypothetical protein